MHISSIENTINESHQLSHHAEEISELYTKLGYSQDMIMENGLSRPLVKGMNYNNELYDLLQDLPSLESLPMDGDPFSEDTSIAVESIGNVLSKFWEWIKKTCISIRDILRKLMTKAVESTPSISAIIRVQAKRIAYANIDNKKLNSTRIRLIPFKSHLQVLKALPSLTAELKLSADTVSIADWKGRTQKALKAAGIGMMIAAPMVTNKVGDSVAFKGARTAVSMNKTLNNLGVDPKVSNNFANQTGTDMISDGATIKKSGIVTTGVGVLLAAKMLRSWVAFGCQVRADGLVDMSKFNNNEIFQTTRGTVGQLGWTQKTVMDYKQLLNALDLTKQASAAAKKITDDLTKLESEITTSIPSNGHVNPKAVRIMRREAQTKLNGAISVQKLTTGMVYASLKLAKNFMIAQKAVIHCSDMAKVHIEGEDTD